MSAVRGALAIFVKTPGLSPVKTRLQAGRGGRFAEQWHRLSAQASASVGSEVADRCGLQPHWAVAEEGAMQHPLWSGLPCLAQGEGGLGERMARVHALLVERHGFGILIGADAPQLRAETFSEAAGWLCSDQPRCALGPAEDGGFWLFGGNRVLPTEVWTSVRYSRRETGRDFGNAIAAFGSCLALPMLRDVDHQEDLAPVFAALRALPMPTVEQQALMEWLNASLPADESG